MIKTPTDRPLTNQLLVGTTLFLKDLNKKKYKNIKEGGSRKRQLDRVLGNVIFGTAFWLKKKERDKNGKILGNHFRHCQ